MIPTRWSVTSTPVVLAGNVYFGDWGGNVYSAKVDDGKINWKVNLENAISSTLTAAGGRIYVSLSPQDTNVVHPNNGNRVVALSQATGDVIWQTKLPSTAHGVWGSPTLFDGMIYVGTAAGFGQEESLPPFTGGSIFALNAKTGAIVWTKALYGTAGGAGLWGSVSASPDLNAIYFATGNPYSSRGTVNDAYAIVSLNAKTGKENWRFRLFSSLSEGGDNDFGATPNVFAMKYRGGTRRVVGAGNKNGVYYIVDASTGKLLQQVRPQDNTGISGNAAVVGATGGLPTVFVPSYGASLDVAAPKNQFGYVSAIDPATGQVLWSFLNEANVIGSVAAVPGAVIFGNAKGYIYAVSAKGGRKLFEKRLSNAIDAGVTPAEGHLFVTTAQGDPDFPDKSMDAKNNGVYAFAP
jgi:polyvinyl alcohol dehydrogenase (cytochrome)